MQPPTEEEEHLATAETEKTKSTSKTQTEKTDRADASTVERRAVRVGGVKSYNEETGEQVRRRIAKQRIKDQN